MPSSTSNGNKFTDHDLALFYTRFLQHYNECKTYYLPDNIQGLSNEMYTAMYNALYVQSVNSPLYYLKPSEKDKVYQAFNSFFEALTSKLGCIPVHIPYASQEQPRQRIVITERAYNNYYCHHDSFLLDWWLIAALMNDCHSYHHHRYPYPAGGYGSHHHGHSSNFSNKDYTQILAVLALVALALVAAIATYVALHYMFVESLEGIDRFYYNEGRLRAALMLASSIGFGVASTIASMTLVAGPLTGLALMAGLNPAIVLITATVVFATIGAGIGSWAMSVLYDTFAKNSGKDAIDLKDPLRYRLTTAEEEGLRTKGIDPYKVKCALVILRGEIAKVTDKEQKFPTFLSRTKEQNKLLQQVRDLRCGKLTVLDVGGMYLNCIDSLPPAYDDIYTVRDNDISFYNTSSY